MYSHPNILGLSVEGAIPAPGQISRRTCLIVVTDAEIDASSPNYDALLVVAITEAANRDWVEVLQQPPETEVRLVRGKKSDA